ncbi:Uncharacterized protein BM_BM14218 [Brugia malayi]|uniref:Bm14218 n=1 Tax=Brugia malayi TaxID=6279 RepID=A0A0K0J0K0_BRUMA|nr:Uncharacterized protein BM_BM14218 [Brugia malayi]CDP96814.1 Bm14218 [Brugia malayi]VIO94244.1 Uncharacterized protein BM_BM14218 [Brugia malayi]
MISGKTLRFRTVEICSSILSIFHQKTANTRETAVLQKVLRRAES